MNSLRRSLPRLASLFLLVPLVASAPPGHEFGWDFSGGFCHPFTGWDHLLAMFVVGYWAAQLGGRARWLVPAAFVGLMAFGALLRAAAPRCRSCPCRGNRG